MDVDKDKEGGRFNVQGRGKSDEQRGLGETYVHGRRLDEDRSIPAGDEDRTRRLHGKHTSLVQVDRELSR
jgi:hypothetical protein